MILRLRVLCFVCVLAVLASTTSKILVKVRGASAALSLLGVFGGVPDITQASSDACTSTTSAISGATVDSCRTVGLVKGSLRGCRANENCFSTSAVAAGKNRPPWTYDGITAADNDGATAVKFLRSAIEASGLKVLQNKVVEEGSSKYFYILGAERGDNRKEKQPAGSSLFYEFKVLPREKLVLYRAFVDKTVFLYPLQEPVSDFGALDARLDDIRGRVGWLKVSSD